MQRPERLEPIWGVLVGVLVGLLLALLHKPRTGMWLVAGTFAFAGAARLLLSTREIGLLAVRSRRIDVAAMLTLAVAIGALAAVSPLHH